MKFSVHLAAWSSLVAAQVTPPVTTTASEATEGDGFRQIEPAAPTAGEPTIAPAPTAIPAPAPPDTAAPPAEDPAPKNAAAAPASGSMSEPEAGGTHFRIETAQGPVHLFRPEGYDRATAGVVVYVHGYYTRIDQAWREHGLAEQFAASRRNALFIAPDAPGNSEESSRLPGIGRLVARACRAARMGVPHGPWVVVGHSAAYRTIVPWLQDARIRHVILVDALYGNEPDFRRWLDAERTHKMTLIVKGTAKWAIPFTNSIPYAVRAPRVPRTLRELSPAQRTAKLLYLPSQIGHFELITEGRVLPVVIRRTGLRVIRRPPTSH